MRGAEPHGGGVQLTPDSTQYKVLQDFLNIAQAQIPEQKWTAEKPRDTYRRASLLLTGRIPKTYPSLETEEQLLKALEGLFDQEEFLDFVKRGANDRLLTRSINSTFSLDFFLFNFYPMYASIVAASGRNTPFTTEISREIGEAPLELIAYVVKNNRPYSEILTADYTMVGHNTAKIFENNTIPDPGTYLTGKDEGQLLSTDSSGIPSTNWENTVRAFAEPVGILSSLGYLQQYQTNATNRNRARARWTLQHFLGIDIENSAARNIDASVLIDTNGGITSRLACKVCHDRIDPVAGAFQRYGTRGLYLDGAYGMDTLDSAYKASNFYQSGDTWYRTMLPPGLEGKAFKIDNTIFDTNPLRTLAQEIVKHPKFAEGTVKFWWQAFFGEELLPYSLDESQLLARQIWLDELSAEFRQSNYNLKQLFKAIIISPYFRGIKSQAFELGRERRLLTPEELRNKTRSLSQFDDIRLSRDWQIIYGGIDSFNVEKRQRDFNSMMHQVAKRHAIETSCQLMLNTRNAIEKTRSITKTSASITSNNTHIIHVDKNATPYQLSIKTTGNQPHEVQVKFISDDDIQIDYGPIVLSAQTGWASDIQTLAGRWELSTSLATPIPIESLVINYPVDAYKSMFASIGFDFWGDTSGQAALELEEFYWRAHSAVDPLLVSNCTSVESLQPWEIQDLGRWRLLYIRTLNDYRYLYE